MAGAKMALVSLEHSLWTALCCCPRDTEFAIVSMASEIGTNVVTLHLEFCHWNKL